MTILAWLAISSLVWGAVIWSVGRVLQRSGDVSGRARQWIWRGATVLLVAPWIAAPLVAALGWGLAPSDAVMVSAAPTTLATLPMDEFTGEMLLDFTGAPAPAAIVLDLTQMLLMVLAGGWIVRFVLAQYAAKSLLGIVAVSRLAEKGAATVALAAWTKRLGLRRAPRLRIVNEAVSPFSFGIFRPVICLPEGLEDKLSREALTLVIGHECLHVARGDGWWRPLERIAADVMWFNPAAWLIRRELDVARELACDEGMVELSSARQAYARTLRDVAGFSAGLSHAAPAASMSLAGGRSLMLRVTRTLSLAKRKPARSAVVAAIMLGLVGAPMAVAQVMMVMPAPPAPPAPPAAPVAPQAPAAAEIDEDGSVRATFAGRITLINGGKQNGYNVRLEGESEGSPCVADLNGLVSIAVAKGDAVAEHGLIGKRESGRNLRVSVTCTDGREGKEHSSLAIPPAPAAPAAPAMAAVEIAELAGPPQPRPTPRPNANPNPNPNANPNPNPSPNPSPAPKAQLVPAPPAPPAPMAPMATPAPPAPPVPMAPQATPLSPLPRAKLSPVSDVAPVSPVAPAAPAEPATLAEPVAPVEPADPVSRG